MTELLTLDIESIAAGGDGVARHDGLVVFVPRTAAGDRVVARVVKKGRLARGVVEHVEVGAPTRVAPECPHYDGDRCGGCQLQHLSLDAQREAKRHIVRDTLRRIGRRDIPLPEVHGGDRAWRYRGKLTLAMRREHGHWRGGLHAFDDPESVFPLDDCRIADQRLLAAWRDVLQASSSLPDTNRLRVALRLLGERVALVVEGGRHWPDHVTFAARVPSLAALWWAPEGASRRLLDDRRGDTAPAASFVQVNAEVAAVLAAHVVDRVMHYQPSTVIDAYAGAGDIAATLAGRGVRVTAIEIDPEASHYSATRLPDGSRAVTAPVEEALAGALPADAVLLNPPRAGIDASVAALLESAEPRPAVILYVSCDPATLARDVSRLPGWRIADVSAFDMFPQTAHVETVCELVRGDAP